MPNKAVAAGASAATAGALVTLLLAWWGHPVAPEVANALTTLACAGLGAAGAYFAKYEGN